MQEMKRMNITKEQFSKVEKFFENLDANHPKMNLKKEKSPYHQKVERFKERARSGMVIIEQLNHELEGQWIPKEKAQGLIYTDPVIWLREKGIEGFQ